MSKITDITTALAEPIVAEQGCTLWDVEYVKEAGSFYLRIFIDKEEGISIDDCEAVSRALSDALDEADPIQDPYTFEVSSAGADRILKTETHFMKYIDSLVDIRLYKAITGSKTHTATLKAYDKGDISVLLGEETVTFTKQDLAQVRLHISF